MSAKKFFEYLKGFEGEGKAFKDEMIEECEGFPQKSWIKTLFFEFLSRTYR